MAPGATSAGLQVNPVLPVYGELKSARTKGAGLRVKDPAAVARGAGGCGLVLVRHGSAAIGVEHGCPHGIVKGRIVVPETGFRTADALVFYLNAPRFLVVQLLVAVVVGAGPLAIVALQTAMGRRAAPVKGFTMTEGGSSVRA